MFNARAFEASLEETEASLEETLAATRRTNAVAAVSEIQLRSVEQSTDSATLEEINAEIAAVRRGHRPPKPGAGLLSMGATNPERPRA